MNGNCGECDRRWYCVIDPEKCDNLSEPVLTNADKIRAMSDEELANLLTDFSNNGGWITEIGREICYKRITDWLQQPVKEEQ